MLHSHSNPQIWLFHKIKHSFRKNWLLRKHCYWTVHNTLYCKQFVYGSLEKKKNELSYEALIECVCSSRQTMREEKWTWVGFRWNSKPFIHSLRIHTHFRYIVQYGSAQRIRNKTFFMFGFIFIPKSKDVWYSWPFVVKLQEFVFPRMGVHTDSSVVINLACEAQNILVLIGNDWLWVHWFIQIPKWIQYFFLHLLI